ncbi:peptidoglycan-binding protein [Oxynema sp. CENA135]|uniref:peptidoglycan-binding domain-containing protein n=1 Tax=Oxynema sp. CENA135 TaxID=984206 RepID=UPI00190B1939|nr:peptidoglycan-binding protein [Oxynema sp. CENA135]MBK4731670.1 peptidoglycan-binding protein [Oxynema sp. CENA135]
METLAYIELARAYESQGDRDLPKATPRDRRFVWLPCSMPQLLGWSVLALLLAIVAPVPPTAAQTVFFQQGDSGPSVRSIQQRLKSFGYFNTDVTDYYGPITEAAVIEFQRANALPVTGIVDSQTLQAMGRMAQRSAPVQSFTATPAQGFGTVTAVSSSNQVLRVGDRGVEVSALQQQLQQLGYFAGPVTGAFDYDTETAVIRFQQNNNLRADGLVGSNTRAALASQPQPAPTSQGFVPRANTSGEIRYGDRGSQVRSLQQRLAIAGFPPSRIDGIFGDDTEISLKEFQQAYGLPPSGVADPTTRRSLDRKLYVVVVPQFRQGTLEAVRQIFPDAFAADSRLGDYVHVGSSLRREIAEERTKLLRSQGFVDARVAYF